MGTFGIREQKDENLRLKKENEQLATNMDLLHNWNVENMRNIVRQEERLEKVKSAEKIIKNKDEKFKTETTRLLRGWKARQEEFQHALKNITRLETDRDDLIKERDELKMKLKSLGG